MEGQEGEQIIVRVVTFKHWRGGSHLFWVWIFLFLSVKKKKKVWTFAALLCLLSDSLSLSVDLFCFFFTPSFVFQVQMLVTVRAVEEKFKTRFTWKSSRTPGTTPAFSESTIINNACEHCVCNEHSLGSDKRMLCWHRRESALTWTQLFVPLLHFVLVDDPRSFCPVASTLGLKHCSHAQVVSSSVTDLITGMIQVFLTTDRSVVLVLLSWSGGTLPRFCPSCLGGLMISTLGFSQVTAPQWDILCEPVAGSLRCTCQTWSDSSRVFPSFG